MQKGFDVVERRVIEENVDWYCPCVNHFDLSSLQQIRPLSPCNLGGPRLLKTISAFVNREWCTHSAVAVLELHIWSLAIFIDIYMMITCVLYRHGITKLDKLLRPYFVMGWRVIEEDIDWYCLCVNHFDLSSLQQISPLSPCNLGGRRLLKTKYA